MGARQRRKTAVITMRIDPRVKAAAELAAESDRRSLTSLVEILIINHCKLHNIKISNLESEEAIYGTR
jgi:predicted HicB family RNase H-like nuclease